MADLPASLTDRLASYPDMGGTPGHVAYEHYVADPGSLCIGCIQLRRQIWEAHQWDAIRRNEDTP